MSESRLTGRMRVGAEYLASVAEPRWKDWHRGYAEFQQGRLSIPESLALAHPQWWSAKVDRELIQGPRAFEATDLVQGWPCQAERLWGYRCQLATDARPRLDHVFPYALGGPTASSNRLTLCEAHNQAKAGDVHLFPWEEGQPSWLGPTLRQIDACLGAS